MGFYSLASCLVQRSISPALRAMPADVGIAHPMDLEDAELLLFSWRAALAQEMLVHFSRISKDLCLAHRLRAPICRWHCASFSQGGTALLFSSLASDDWVRFIGTNELFA